MAVVMEAGGSSSSWRKAHDVGRDFLLQSSNSSNKSDDSSKPSTSSTSGASTVIALAGGVCGQTVMQQSKKRAWGDDLQKTLQLMLGQVPVLPERETLDFLGVSNASEEGDFLELNPNLPLPVGWEKCLDLRTGAVYFLNRASGEKTLVDPRQLVPGLGLGLGLGAAPATPSFHDAEADRNSDSPGTPPRSAARNFFSGVNSSSPSPRRERGAIESCSGLFSEPAAPMPWALEHWAAAAKGFSERNPLPAATPAAATPELRFSWLPGQHGLGTMAAPAAVEEDSSCQWRRLNSAAGEERVLGDYGMGSNLELKLSSSSSGLDGAAAGVLVRDEGRSVCTMEKVREALLRSDKMSGKLVAQPHNQSWSRSSCQPLFNLRAPASPSHSSSSASSSTPPSIHDLGETRASPPKRVRSCSPKSNNFPQAQQQMLASSSCYRVSSPNGVSSSSNVSSPAHPSSAGHLPCSGSSPASTCCTGINNPSFLSPNLASLKLASPSLSELERGSPSQVLTLGGGSSSSAGQADSGSSAVALACCKSCLMYMLLSREDPRCPRCRNCVDVGFAPSGPCSSQLLPPLKKAKLEVDL